MIIGTRSAQAAIDTGTLWRAMRGATSSYALGATELLMPSRVTCNCLCIECMDFWVGVDDLFHVPYYSYLHDVNGEEDGY